MSRRDRRTLVEAARLYYVEGMDQSAIGAVLGLSKSGVSRILRAAKDEGIVRFQIVDDEEVARSGALESQLEAAFGLRQVRVARDEDDPLGGLDRVARLGAEVFAELAPGASRIGFGWGVSIQRLTEEIPPQRLAHGTALVPLVGGMPTVDTAMSGNHMLVALSERTGARAERFDAPAIVESRRTYEALGAESSVRAALDRARAVDLAFVGIGSFGRGTSRRVVEAMRLDATETAAFLAHGPQGDMCGHFFDAQGRALSGPSSQRVIGLTLKELRAVPLVVGIAAGAERRPGVRAALRTGAVDMLVLDEPLARGLLEEASGEDSDAAAPAGPSRCPHCGQALPAQH